MAISGLLPPIATPFDAHGALDGAALKSNVERWSTTGLSGYVVGGSNGESVMLDAPELEEAVRIVRRAAPSDQLVVAGTGQQSTNATIRLTQAAADAGADFALIMNPSFFAGQLGDDALVRHYSTIADASPIPVLVYNVPKFTHANIPVQVVAKLSAHDNIVGIKDSAGDIGQIIDLLRLCGPSFDVLIGSAPAFLAGVEAGAVGGILALANVAPAECVIIWRLAVEGRHEEARRIHSALMPIGRAITTSFGIAGLKAALDLLGYQGGPPRAPILPATDDARRTIRMLLQEASLLSS